MFEFCFFESDQDDARRSERRVCCSWCVIMSFERPVLSASHERQGHGGTGYPSRVASLTAGDWLANPSIGSSHSWAQR